jgi:integrase
MHIAKRTGKKGQVSWRVHVHYQGKHVTKVFRDLKVAKQWGREQERSIEQTGMPSTIEDRKKHTVGEIVQKYLETVTPTKGSSVSETSVLKAFLKRDICKLTLAEIKPKHAHAHIDARLKETWVPKGQKTARPLTPRTVAREKASIQRVFTHARMKQWDGCEDLDNPFERVPIEGSTFERDRKLEPGELEKLLKACKPLRGFNNRFHVPLAIHLAIGTGMRLQEIFNLTWGDIDLEKRTIKIRKSKTDRKQKRPGRTIVMPLRIKLGLWWHAHTAQIREREVNRPIFPMTKDAFKFTWKNLVKRAGIPGEHTAYMLKGQRIEPDGQGLKFLDLRREAATRFHAAGLTEPETQYMLGHGGNTVTTKVYIQVDPKVIADKLDRYYFGPHHDKIKFEDWLFILMRQASPNIVPLDHEMGEWIRRGTEKFGDEWPANSLKEEGGGLILKEIREEAKAAADQAKAQDQQKVIKFRKGG